MLAAIRANERTRSLPLIMLSARAGEESRIEGLSAGADDYLTKPFSARELLARIGSQLQLAQMRRKTEQMLRFHSEQFETLLNRAPLGVYLVDAEFRIAQVNPVAMPHFGEIPGGVVGRDFDEIIHLLLEKSAADEVVEIFRHTLQTGEPHLTAERADFRIDRGVTEYYEWHVDRITLPDGRYGLVCYFRDISAHVHIRQALTDADRKKDEFLATLAHELRGPLAPLRNTLEIVKRSEDDSQLFRKARDTMERQLEQLGRLADDLIDVSRITQNKVELRKDRIELGAIIRQAVETCTPAAEMHRHEVTVQVPSQPIYLDADPVRLGQVFNNLLSNACKYTEPEGHIWITAEQTSTEVVVTVKDTGLGIPKDKLATVFEMFSQIHETLGRSQGGLGIGLMLVKRLVEMHGGTVTARSEGIAGRGSEFIVRLPMLLETPHNVTMPPHEEQSSHDQVAATGRRILVVDDNIDSVESLAMLLEMSGNRD